MFKPTFPIRLREIWKLFATVSAKILRRRNNRNVVKGRRGIEGCYQITKAGTEIETVLVSFRFAPVLETVGTVQALVLLIILMCPDGYSC